jgi:glycosyltransferase involved in cell wall biosynthesis
VLLARPETPPAIEPAKATAIPVTAIVLTLNEAENIRACLAGLARVKDVVIVDSGSHDGTIEAARSERPGIRVLEHPFRDFGEQRNYAIDQCGAGVEWILFVDADEHCTDQFLDEVARFIADPGEKVGAYVAGKNYFLGRWLKHSTLYPSYQLRLLKRGHVRFRKEGHGQLELSDGPLHYLVEGWRHEPFQRGVHHYMERHNWYTTEEAELQRRASREPVQLASLLSRNVVARRRALKHLAARLPGRPLIHFLYLYVVRGGFRDGYPGLMFCAMLLANQIYTQAKVAEAEYRARAAGGHPKD